MTVLSDDCVGLWNYMQASYGTDVIDKDNSAGMVIVGDVLDRMGVLDRDAFLSRFTTTIDHAIYVPFRIGKGTPSELWSQMVTCVHEHQHVLQADTEGFEAFSAKYLLSPRERAAYEAQAYRCNLEMHWWRYGTTCNAREVADRLANYGVGPAYVKWARDYLEISNTAISNGAVANRATRRAVMWLDENAAWLKAA